MHSCAAMAMLLFSRIFMMSSITTATSQGVPRCDDQELRDRNPRMYADFVTTNNLSCKWARDQGGVSRQGSQVAVVQYQFEFETDSVALEERQQDAERAIKERVTSPRPDACAEVQHVVLLTDKTINDDCLEMMTEIVDVDDTVAFVQTGRPKKGRSRSRSSTPRRRRRSRRDDRRRPRGH